MTQVFPSRSLIEDTRNKPEAHKIKNEWWFNNGVATIRSKLAHGDYAYVPVCSVDSKQDIQELYSDITTQHDRFKRECVGALDAGTKLIILTENIHNIHSLADLMNWMEPEREFKKRKGASKRIDGAALAKACNTMHEKYGVLFMFCAPDESAELIVKILTREEREYAKRLLGCSD